MPNYILIQIDDLPHHSGDMDNISIGIQTLLEATGIDCEVNVMSSDQLFDHFNLIENPTERSEDGDSSEPSAHLVPPSTEDYPEEKHDEPQPRTPSPQSSDTRTTANPPQFPERNYHVNPQPCRLHQSLRIC